MKKERGKLTSAKKHRNMVQFETPVRWMKEWMDGKTKEGTSLFIFVFVF